MAQTINEQILVNELNLHSWGSLFSVDLIIINHAMRAIVLEI